MANETENLEIKKAPQEVSDQELDKISGGKNPKCKTTAYDGNCGRCHANP